MLKTGSNGFTLLEVLITIIIVTVGFTVLLQAVSTGLFAGGDNENMLVAVNLANEKMDELRNRTYSNVINETKAAVSGFPAFSREVVTSVIQTGLKQVSVNVYWFVKSAELNLSLVSYVSDI